MKKLTLKDVLFIIFWGFAVIFLLIAVYYSWKKIFFPVKNEIRIPDEHRNFLEALRKYKSLPKKESSYFAFTNNPFYEEKSKVNEKEIQEILKLTSVIKEQKKFCIINGKLYREGDKIGRIKISKIGDYYVELLLPKGKKVKLEVGAAFTYSYSN